ncbi:hypothetical protein AGMMS49982_16230 [Bacteroidia bacterium]|nr:hypothetical protein AGMMS49982_16230 [Bacteroidia bacterium]
MNTETLISLIAIALILLGGGFYLLNKRGKGIPKELPKIVFGVAVFIAGLMLNWAGLDYFYGNNENPGSIFNFGTILSSTLRMFVLIWERALWSPLAIANIFYSIAITLCYTAATIFSGAIILQVLSKVFENFGNSVSLFFLVHSPKKLCVIAGNGVHQKILLENLTQEQKKNAIIILNENNEEAKKEYRAQGFPVISGKISVEILKKAGLFDKRETALIAISDDDVENLEIARTITEHLKTLDESTRAKLSFTARIMYTNIERAEHFKFSETAGGRIQFFNPYEITAREFLFKNPITKFIPAKYINTALARLNTDDFKFLHIFIGFGKANHELLKQSIATNQVLGIDYRALVIDSCLEDSQSAFKNQCPGLFANEAEQGSKKYFPTPKEKYHIEFFECNALSKEMYDKVINHIRTATASSVHISLGNIQLSAETAMELRQRCYEQNIAKEKTNIFVRSKIHSPITVADVLNNDDIIEIATFGFEDEILTLDYIINMDMDKLAKCIAGNYSGSNANKWEALTNQKRETNIYAALSIPIKLNMMGFDMIDDETEQDENTLKEFENTYDIEKARKLRALNNRFSIERDSAGNIANTIRNNLARLEHQRWNAYHLVKGWMPMPKSDITEIGASRRNERTKQHACITTFEGLEELASMQNGEDIMHYDCDLMDCLTDNIKGTKYRIMKKV